MPAKLVTCNSPNHDDTLGSGLPGNGLCCDIMDDMSLKLPTGGIITQAHDNYLQYYYNYLSVGSNTSW